MTIILNRVTKYFGTVAAVNEIDLDIPQGKLLTLLGPSGCGKSTTLRMIAGFLQPDAGQIMLDGQVINTLPPERRPTAMVFQTYALWPHKTVYGNVAFGLKVLKRPRAHIKQKVTEALNLVNLAGLEHRYPRQLSGGQRQRVALARALVVEPRILLLDEPLSNLDAKLRVQMRAEIRQLQRHLGITMIYVTHDQEEALSISDYVTVMHAGRIEQTGPPLEIYQRPASQFVASFMGATNFLSGVVTEQRADRLIVQVGTDFLEATTQSALQAGQPVVLAIKSEAIQPAESLRSNTLLACLRRGAYLGAVTRWEAEAAGTTLSVDLPGHAAPQAAETWLHLHLPARHLIAFPKNGGGPSSA